MRYYDVIVIGSGIAGLSVAVQAAEKGQNVCILSKSELLNECNTYYAQGGIVYKGENDSSAKIARDIIKAGSNINFIDSVNIVAEKGPKTVEDILINKINVPFLKNDEGKLDLTREGAHALRRILHVYDETGKAIENSFLDYISKINNIHCFKSHMAVDIITNSHNSNDNQNRYKQTKAIGVYVYSKQSGEVNKFFSPKIVLATGGIGNLFLHTSNPKGAMGDGVSMAYRAGAEIINSEYIQFHPTVLFHRDVDRFLITEAMRGEGAKLMNLRGEYFMERYNPDLKDLAPRDEVSRAIYREMEKENTSYVLLDTTIIKNVDVSRRFPGIFNKCMEVGIDIRKEPIPVVPAAHYYCGGIKVNLKGETNIPGLYAVGETACTGVHGANRLASVSLLEGLVFGILTGKSVSEKTIKLHDSMINSIPEWVYPSEEEDFDPVLIQNDLRTIQSTMWNYVGIIRTQKRLTRAKADLDYLKHRIERFYKKAKLSNDIIELRNAVTTANIITNSAMSNPVSLGCHYVR